MASRWHLPSKTFCLPCLPYIIKFVPYINDWISTKILEKNPYNLVLLHITWTKFCFCSQSLLLPLRGESYQSLPSHNIWFQTGNMLFWNLFYFFQLRRPRPQLTTLQDDDHIWWASEEQQSPLLLILENTQRFKFSLPLLWNGQMNLK